MDKLHCETLQIVCNDDRVQRNKLTCNTAFGLLTVSFCIGEKAVRLISFLYFYRFCNGGTHFFISAHIMRLKLRKQQEDSQLSINGAFFIIVLQCFCFTKSNKQRCKG